MRDPKRLVPAILLCAFAGTLWPSEAAAQRRGRPVRSGGSTVVMVHPSFYGGSYGYYNPFFWGYGGWHPYGLYAPYYGADAYSRTVGSARIQVTPKQAEVYVDGQVRVHDQFFVAEPQVDALWRVTSWLHLDAGVGYRAIGGADLLRDQLRGVSGSIAVRLGGH